MRIHWWRWGSCQSSFSWRKVQALSETWIRRTNNDKSDLNVRETQFPKQEKPTFGKDELFFFLGTSSPSSSLSLPPAAALSELLEPEEDDPNLLFFLSSMILAAGFFTAPGLGPGLDFGLAGGEGDSFFASGFFSGLFSSPFLTGVSSSEEDTDEEDLPPVSEFPWAVLECDFRAS